VDVAHRELDAGCGESLPLLLGGVGTGESWREQPESEAVPSPSCSPPPWATVSVNGLWKRIGAAEK